MESAPRQAPQQDPSLPRIAVLLATHNGARYLAELVDSVLRQRNVSVELMVSDDQSADGTWEMLQEWSGAEPRIRLLPREGRFGGSAPNFYHLLLSIDPARYAAIAFADQDDVWLDWKLAHHLELLRQHGVGGVSSSILAFWPDGRERTIDKSGAMRRFDHLFQSPGPGCTFLITPALADLVRNCLTRPEFGASTFECHDWLVYAIARTCGLGWHISDRLSVRYRQHGFNEVGVNSGLGAVRRRLRWIVDRTYGRWASRVLHVARSAAMMTGSPPPPETISAFQIALAGRRRLADRLLIAATHPLGVRAEGPDPAEASRRPGIGGTGATRPG
jgi:rhamnosyltransferase